MDAKLSHLRVSSWGRGAGRKGFLRKICKYIMTCHMSTKEGKDTICRKRSQMLMASTWTFGPSPRRRQLEPSVAVATWASLISTQSLWGWLWSSLVTTGMRIGTKTLAVSIVLTKMQLYGVDSTHHIKVSPVIFYTVILESMQKC